MCGHLVKMIIKRCSASCNFSGRKSKNHLKHTMEFVNKQLFVRWISDSHTYS